MEMLIFYWPNLLAGALIAAGLGLVGLHIFARHQALEAFVLGQEIQTSIIVIAYALISLGQHSDHGFHFETIFSLGLAFVMHLFFLRAIGKRQHLRMEYSVAAIFVLMAIGNLLMSFSPLIEGHMVASMLGDIVTASARESYVLAVIGAGLLGLCFFKNRDFLNETVEIALFDRRPKGLGLTVALTVFMGVSVHVLGLLFTISMLLFMPLALNVAGNLSYRSSQAWLIAVNVAAAVLGFASMNWFERVPTSVAIALWCAFLSVVFAAAMGLKRSSKKLKGEKNE